MGGEGEGGPEHVHAFLGTGGDGVDGGVVAGF